MYGFYKERLKHAIQFRNKRGFGVHSPFMFSFIMNVIRDKKGRYNYPSFQEREKKEKNKVKKLLHFLIRIVVSQNIRKVYVDGNMSNLIETYLKRTNIPIEFCKNIEDAELVFIGGIKQKSYLKWIISKQNQFVFIYDVYKNKYNHSLHQLASKQAKVTLDMLWYWLYIDNDTVQPGHYNILL